MLSRKLKKLINNPKKFFKDFFIKYFIFYPFLKKIKFKKYKAFNSYAIVSAVYNVEKYLDDFFKSIINQRLDFKNNILIICVNDGSTDNSPDIIKKYQKKYPKNIIYLSKKNGGQASARNAGLKYIIDNNLKVSWITFTDPDDFLDRDYFYKVDYFLHKNQKEDIAMVATQLIFYYESINVFSNDNILKFLFRGELNLVSNSDYNCIQLSSPSTFFNLAKLKKYNIAFNEKIKLCSEDAQFVARVILNNLNSKTLYISSCLYFYRRRSDGSSTMGKQDKILNDKNFYINTTKEAYLSVVDECLKVNGLIPKSIQRWLLCLYILQFIHLRQAINNSQILKILSDQEVKYFFQIWKKIFSHIDDKLILYENNIALFGIFDKYMTLLLFKSFNDYSESVFVEDYSHDKIKIYYLTLREKKFSIIMDNNILFLEPEKEYFLNKKINKYYHILSKEDFKKLYFKTNKNIIDICYNGNFLKIFYSNFKINFPMIISAKPDGFGMRLSSILVGIYLAKKLNFKFYFLWPKHSDLEEYNIREHGVVIPDSSIVFKEDFLNKYLIAFHNEIKINYGNEIYSKKRTISELKNIDFRKQWGWYSTEKNPSEWIFNINKTECLKDLSKIYSEIGFSLEFNNIIEHAKKVSKEFKNGFIALHIRSGDVIYSESRNLVFHPMMEERYFPYEIAIEIILSQNSSSAIVIFGQDKAANKLLIHFVKSIRKNLQVFAIDDIFEYNDSEKQMFFEVNLLAQAKIIYSVKESAFSKLAMYISGKNNLTSFHDIFSSNEQIYIIKKYFKKLSLPFLQQSMSLFFISKYFYENKEYMKAIRFAKLALNKDQSNYGYIIFLMQNYLQLDDQIKADFTIKKIHSFKEIYIFLKYLFHWSNNEICKNIILKEYDNELIYLNMLKILILIHSNNVSLAIRLFDKFLKNQNYEKLIEVKFYQMMFLNPSIKIRMSLSYRLGYILIQFYKTSINPIRLISLLRNEIDNFNKIKNIIEIEAKQYSFDGKNSEKIKNHLSYKLGNILIKAHKSKFKIGYALLPIKFFIIIYNHKRGKI